MKIVYQSEDGITFANEVDCIEYEKIHQLTVCGENNITSDWDGDANRYIIEVEDVVKFITNHWVQISNCVKQQNL